VVTSPTQDLVNKGELTPILVTQGSVYPGGRMMNILLKGIDPAQKILALPAGKLHDGNEQIPALIGKRMAETAKLKAGDQVLVRWRDNNGTFDAREVTIVDVFDSNVPTIDNGQIWIPLEALREMTGMTGEATYLVAGDRYTGGNSGSWIYKDPKFLLKEFDQVMKSKKVGSSVMYLLLLAIALLAIFDTQVLSVFRRQKEIGTYIALGMTRFQVMKLFTVEGSMHSILALLLGGLYGIPILAWLHYHGIPMPKSAGQMGISITDSIIPVYGVGMVLSTVMLVVISATIVSFFPARRITKMKPTDALKGKIQ
jgi:ABC-type lipoprotein release transport system permease subunit